MVSTGIASTGAGFIQLGLGVLLSTYVESMGPVIQISKNVIEDAEDLFRISPSIPAVLIFKKITIKLVFPL